jgi:hypothetical protein
MSITGYFRTDQFEKGRKRLNWIMLFALGISVEVVICYALLYVLLPELNVWILSVVPKENMGGWVTVNIIVFETFLDMGYFWLASTVLFFLLFYLQTTKVSLRLLK